MLSSSLLVDDRSRNQSQAAAAETTRTDQPEPVGDASKVGTGGARRSWTMGKHLIFLGVFIWQATGLQEHNLRYRRSLTELQEVLLAD